MAPLAVDPAALDGAGATLTDVGKDIGLMLSTLEGTLSACGGMCGDDPVGEAMGQSYDSAAASLVKAVAASRNGMVNLGDGVRMSAHNYSMAEALSDGRGGAEPLPLPAASGAISAGDPPTAVGGGIPAPAGFGWVSKYIGMIWPTADSAQLRTAAGAWIAAGTDLLVTQTAAAPALGVIGAQQIPEAEAMGQAFVDSLNAASQVMSHATSIAAKLNSYADKVDEVHAAIIDLLARICDPLTGAKVIWDFLTDEEESEIKEIAEDIRTVVDHFATQVAALAVELTPVVTAAGDIAASMLKLADKEWEQFLQGNPVGQIIDDMAQATKGFALQGWELVESVGWTYNPLRAFVDPLGSYNDYGSLVSGMAPLVGADADGFAGTGDAWLKVGKDTVHWDMWGTNPAEAFGRSVFDLATFFVPGGALTKLGTVGHGVAETAESVARAAPHLPDAPRVPDVPRVPDPPKPPELPPAAAPVTPEPPKAPQGGAPVSPTAPGSGGGPTPAPGGSPSHHGPTSSGPPAGAPADGGRPSSGSVNSPAPAAAGDGAPPPGASNPAPATAGDAGRPPSGPSFSPSPAAAAGDGGQLPSGLPTSAAPSAPAGSPGGLPSSDLGDAIGAAAEAADDGKPGAGTGASSEGIGAEADSSLPGKSDEDLVSVGAGPNDVSASGGSTGDPLPPSGPLGSDDMPGSGGPGPPDDGPVSAPGGQGESNLESSEVEGRPAEDFSDPVHSIDPSGDGWTRIADGPDDPKYGEPLPGPHWSHDSYPDLASIDPKVRDLISDPDAPYGRDPGGTPYSKEEYEQRYNKISEKGDQWNNYPPNGGASEGTRVQYYSLEAFARDYGSQLDRLGSPSGEYLAMMEVGNPATFEARGLPINSLNEKYYSYELSGQMPGGWKVEISEVAPAFGREGGSLQVRFFDAVGERLSISDLIEYGVLR